MSPEPDGPLVWQASPFSPRMVVAPGGNFVMGGGADDKFTNDTERPAHRVDVTAFSLGQFPVTTAEYRMFARDHRDDADPALPAVRVSWDDAVAYCEWLSRETNVLHRLPSEAEWEFACRAGSDEPFACGSGLTPHDANYLYSETGDRIGPGGRTRRGDYPANAFGFFDLHGNVCEWVHDIWHPDYIGAPCDGSAWMRSGDACRRVVRGGAWDYLPRLLRNAWRDGLDSHCRRDNVGFRVASSSLGR